MLAVTMYQHIEPSPQIVQMPGGQRMVGPTAMSQPGHPGQDPQVQQQQAQPYIGKWCQTRRLTSTILQKKRTGSLLDEASKVHWEGGGDC